ncbi:UNVERIFIED_CONTAM: hypothetical protein Sradi_3862600 [Sesamum radiatum]|uniref:Uncharacterized protein n=1 Tax=Sesamum radiatum TaxID=300843 RepID=A0AAW2Q1U7_SESRA
MGPTTSAAALEGPTERVDDRKCAGMHSKRLNSGMESGTTGEPGCPRRGARRELRVHMLLAA